MNAREVAVKAARAIAEAINSVDFSSGGVMVLWPIELKVLHNGQSHIFDFVSLVKESGFLDKPLDAS